jgi:hypothetical protein
MASWLLLLLLLPPLDSLALLFVNLRPRSPPLICVGLFVRFCVGGHHGAFAVAAWVI